MKVYSFSMLFLLLQIRTGETMPDENDSNPSDEPVDLVVTKEERLGLLLNISSGLIVEMYKGCDRDTSYEDLARSAVDLANCVIDACEKAVV